MTPLYLQLEAAGVFVLLFLVIYLALLMLYYYFAVDLPREEDEELANLTLGELVIISVSLALAAWLQPLIV
jgi:hypothetical protein